MKKIHLKRRKSQTVKEKRKRGIYPAETSPGTIEINEIPGSVSRTVTSGSSFFPERRCQRCCCITIDTSVSVLGGQCFCVNHSPTHSLTPPPTPSLLFLLRCLAEVSPHSRPPSSALPVLCFLSQLRQTWMAAWETDCTGNVFKHPVTQYLTWALHPSSPVCPQSDQHKCQRHRARLLHPPQSIKLVSAHSATFPHYIFIFFYFSLHCQGHFPCYISPSVFARRHPAHRNTHNSRA